MQRSWPDGKHLLKVLSQKQIHRELCFPGVVPMNYVGNTRSLGSGFPHTIFVAKIGSSWISRYLSWLVNV